MSRVLAVARKEIVEYRRDKLIVITMGVLPVVFLLLPLTGALLTPSTASVAQARAVASEAMLLFLLIPTFLPTTLAAYLVIGERDHETLEPVLTTPVTDGELLLGKALAATLPALALAWVFFTVFAVLTRLFAAPVIVAVVWRLPQLVAQLLLAPALCAFAIVVGMSISVRVRDVRVAQQLSGVSMLPVIGGVALLSLGIFAPSIHLFVLAALAVALVDAAGALVLRRIFNRERLLTRFGAGS